MLYVFHVDSGRMMSFDMNLALETVQFLKETIERHHAIPAFSQVLLVSGGENLDARNRVCSYTAGTDTNPIYMFSTIPDTRNQSAPWPSIDNDNDLKSEVDACLELPPTYNTVVRRAQLAQQICEMGREELKMCEKLVHEQHLQHQGWTAVIANMEDITAEFEKKAEDYMKIFEEHIERRTAYKDYLENFDVDLEKLSRIPILPPLIKGAEDKPFNAFDDVYAEDKAESAKNEPETNEAGNAEEPEQDTAKSDEKSSSGGGSTNNQSLTLLQWISSSENHKSLRRMAESCTKELEIFDKKIMDKLKIDINNAIDHARRDDMKEIKGLEERLRGLENLMSDARKTVQEQNELAQAFLLNQNRASNLGDPSILPDLCNSHRSQLLVMLKNNKKLRDIHMRCAKAKDELGKNLVQRLKYIIHIENKMYEIDNTLLFYHRCLRRLQTHLGIIEQIHQAPCIYVQAVTEVVRRKIFSSAYLMWASDLARHLITIYKDEVDLREKFKYVFEGHFLTTLFPGIDDIPPKFATDAPSVFDGSLPNLSREDLSELDTYLPDLTKENQLPNLDTIIEFFSFRSFKNSSNKSIETSDKSSEKYPASNKKILSLRSQHKEILDKEIESETDTEEYEKVTSQLPDWRNVSVDATIQVLLCDNGTLTDPMSTADSETLTEENLHTSKIEVEKLKEIITILKQTYQEALKTLQQELSNIKQHAIGERGEFEKLIEELSKSFDKLKEETKNNERELIQRLTVDHELEMNDLRKSLYEKNDELAVMLNDKKDLEEKYNEISMRTSSERDLLQRNIDTLKDRVLLLETQLKDANNSKALAVKEIKDKLQHDHRNEIESLRCKFKLMTNMERSPSDTSLEKIERPDILEIGEHEAIVNQLKENFEVEKERAIKEAIEMERQKFQQQISSESFVRSNIPESPKSFTSSSQDIMRRLVEEKERQLDKLREHTNVLQRENNRLKETIQTLTDSDVDISDIGNLKDRVEALQKEKMKIERELEKEKSKRAKLLSSCQNATGVTINSCSKNDNVMVVYNSGHNQFTIVQDSPLLYFLHAESYSGLNLMTIQPNQIPKICYCIGKVIDKEYCHAKKDENRYKVGKGTKFYRVKVRPLSPSRDMDKSTIERRKRRERQSITDSTITIEGSVKLSENQMERNSQVITSQLIDSFAQTDLNLGASTSSSTPHDMVDSGVDSSGNKSSSIYKERNISVTEEDEPISLSDDRFRYKSVSEDDGVSNEALEKKKDEIEASGLLTLTTTNTTAIDDSDEYRSFSETKDEDTEL